MGIDVNINVTCIRRGSEGCRLVKWAGQFGSVVVEETTRGSG
jgi:hypothetical protein